MHGRTLNEISLLAVMIRGLFLIRELSVKLNGRHLISVFIKILSIRELEHTHKAPFPVTFGFLFWRQTKFVMSPCSCPLISTDTLIIATKLCKKWRIDCPKTATCSVWWPMWSFQFQGHVVSFPRTPLHKTLLNLNQYTFIKDVFLGEKM